MTPFVYNTSVTTKEDVEVIVVRLCDRSVLVLCRRVSTMALFYFCEKDALRSHLCHSAANGMQSVGVTPSDRLGSL